jgi:hypothetical protein
MPQPKFKESFYKATPHLFDGEVFVLTKKEAEAVKGTVPIQVDATTYLNMWPTPPYRWQAFCGYLEKTSQLDPIMVDEKGYVLDGFATWFALAKLKVPAKDILIKVITHFKTDAEKITWMRSRKLARANLTKSQRKELEKAEIIAHPERGNNYQAQLLGVDHKTIGKYRQELEALGPKNGGIKWFDKLVGANGRKDQNPGNKPVPETKGKPRGRQANDDVAATPKTAEKPPQQGKDKLTPAEAKPKAQNASNAAPSPVEGDTDAKSQETQEVEKEKPISVQPPFDQPDKDRVAAVYAQNGPAPTPIQLMTNLIIPGLKKVAEGGVSENEVPFLANAIKEALALIEALKQKYAIS